MLLKESKERGISINDVLINPGKTGFWNNSFWKIGTNEKTIEKEHDSI